MWMSHLSSCHGRIKGKAAAYPHACPGLAAAGSSHQGKLRLGEVNVNLPGSPRRESKAHTGLTISKACKKGTIANLIQHSKY